MQHSAFSWRSHARKLEEVTVSCLFYTVRSLRQRFGIAHRTLSFRYSRGILRISSLEHFRHSIDPLPTIRRSSHIWHCLSFLRLLDCKPYSPNLILFCIVARPARDSDRSRDLRVNKISVAPFASSANETSPFELGDELSHLGRR